MSLNKHSCGRVGGMGGGELLAVAESGAMVVLVITSENAKDASSAAHTP